MHWIDPTCLPETAGAVDCFLMNADGETDGFVLTDGTEIRIPPRMGAAVRDTLPLGRAVRVRGVRPRHAYMIAVLSVQPEDGVLVVDDGPPMDKEAHKKARKHAHPARTSSEIEGIVRRLLHGPKGEVRGVLLEDGRSGRFAPHNSIALAPLLQPGSSIVMRGDALVTENTTVVAVREIGASREDMCCLDGKAHKPKPGHHRSRSAPGTEAAPAA